MAIEGKFRRHAVEVKLHLKVIFVNVGLLLFQILNNCTRVIVMDKQGTIDHLSTETFTNKAQICRNIQSGGFPMKFNMFHCIFLHLSKSICSDFLYMVDGQESRCFSHQAQLQPKIPSKMEVASPP